MASTAEQIETIIDSVLWAAKTQSYDNFNKIFPDEKAKEISELLAPLFNKFKEVNDVMKGFSNSFDMSVTLKDGENNLSESQRKLIEECYLADRISKSV